MHRPSRRTVLHGAIGLAGASLGLAALRPRAALAQVRADDVGTQDLGGGLHVLTAAGANALALTAVDGVVLVDGAPASSSAALLKAVASLPGAGPIHTLFNTHWHPEHTGSNETLGNAGASIVAQENTRLWLTTEVTWPWNGETVQPLPKSGRPNKTFYARDELTVRDQRVQYGHLRDCPHTDGDLYVYFPAENVLAVGGAVSGEGWQTPDWWTGGWIGGLVGGLEHLLKLANADTRIVPARGPVLRRAELQRQFDMYSVIWERLAKMLYTGRGPEEAVAANPTKEFDALMGNPDEFVARSFRSMWAYLTPDA
jgi:glyoxylase-like metal-dependent hydrolase (beta-lactamase superfamily II)